MAIKLPGALEFSAYQKLSAVFGSRPMFVGFWVADVGVRLLKHWQKASFH
jgi:hypothetical protein